MRTCRAVSSNYTWADGRPVEFSFGETYEVGGDSIGSPMHGKPGRAKPWARPTPPDGPATPRVVSARTPKHARVIAGTPTRLNSDAIDSTGAEDGAAESDDDIVLPRSPRRIVGSSIPAASAQLPTPTATAIAIARRYAGHILLPTIHNRLTSAPPFITTPDQHEATARSRP